MKLLFLTTRNTSLVNLNSLSAIDQQIKAALDQKQKELAQQSSAQAQSDALTFTLLDKDGNRVNQAAGLNTSSVSAQSATQVANNFDFASNIPQTTKDNLIKEYPKIQAFYGPRSNTNKIKVVESTGYLGRSFYDPSDNAINLTLDSLTDIQASTHELIHAFHGPANLLRPLWEEGMTESSTQIILGNVDPYYMAQGGLEQYEINNLPYLDFNLTTNAEGEEAYLWGCATIYKIYLENPNFYKEFNAELYAASKTDPYSFGSDSNLIKMVYQVVPSVENENTLDWFSHQYPFVSPGPDGSLTFLDSDWIAQTYYYDGKVQFATNVDPTTDTKYKSVDIKTYYSNGTLTGECSGSFSDPNFAPEYLINTSYCKNVKFIPGYKGYLENIVTTNGDVANKRISYSPIITTHEKDYIIGIVNGKSEQAKITNLDTGWNATFPIANGLFTVSDKNGGLAGRYKVDIISAGKIIKTHYFNKASTNGYDSIIANGSLYTVFVDLQPTNNIGVTATALNYSSFKLNINSNSYSGYTFRLNGIPLFRSWDASENYIYSNLNKGTTYSWGVIQNSSSNFGVRYTGTIKTLSGPDFKLTKVEKLGNVQNSTFKLKFTFNIPYNSALLNQVKLFLDYKEPGFTNNFPIKATQTSPTTFEVAPTTKLYNNATYYIDGIENLADATGDPIVGYNPNSTYFSTDINPAGAPQPTENLASTSISQGGKLQINTNFISSQWTNHFTAYIDGPISFDPKAMGGTDGGGGEFGITMQVKNNILSGTLPTGLKSGQSYEIFIPATIDSNNNLVPGKYLDFSVI